MPRPAEAVDHEDKINARLLNHVAWNARWRDRAFSIDAATRALMMAGVPGGLDPGEAGLALRTLAWQATWQGRFSAAEDYARRAIPFLESAGTWAALSDAHLCVATLHLTRFRLDLARGSVGIARETLLRDKRPESWINLLCTESILHRAHQAETAAFACLTEALHHARGSEEARVLHQLSRFYVDVEDHREAMSHAERSVLSARRWDNRVVLPYALEYHGSLLAASGEADTARACLGEALEIARDDKDLRAECFVLTRLGEMDALDGNLESAAGRLKVAREKTERLGLPIWEQRVLGSLAGVLEQKGEFRGAFEALKAYRAVMEAVRF